MYVSGSCQSVSPYQENISLVYYWRECSGFWFKLRIQYLRGGVGLYTCADVVIKHAWMSSSHMFVIYIKAGVSRLMHVSSSQFKGNNPGIPEEKQREWECVIGVCAGTSGRTNQSVVWLVDLNVRYSLVPRQVVSSLIGAEYWSDNGRRLYIYWK